MSEQFRMKTFTTDLHMRDGKVPVTVHMSDNFGYTLVEMVFGEHTEIKGPAFFTHRSKHYLPKTQKKSFEKGETLSFTM